MRPPRTRARGEPSFLLSLVLTGVLVEVEVDSEAVALEDLLLVLEALLVEEEAVSLVELLLVVPVLLRLEELPVEVLEPEVVEAVVEAVEESVLEPEVDDAEVVLALALALPWNWNCGL